jgi:hypothetical protein
MSAFADRNEEEENSAQVSRERRSKLARTGRGQKDCRLEFDDWNEEQVGHTP